MSLVLVRVVECVLEALVAIHSAKPSMALRDLKGGWIKRLSGSLESILLPT